MFLRTGETDCHSQFENWLRNDRGLARTTVGSLIVRRGGALPLPRATARVAPTDTLEVYTAGRCGHRPLRVHNKRCGEEFSPFRQGGRGDGLPRALRALAMTHYKMRYKPGGRTGFAMTGGFTWVRWADEWRQGNKKGADSVVRPNRVLKILDRK